MKISRENYEAFFLDFHEGDPGEDLRKEVLAFLALNPDLQEEFHSFESFSLPGENVRFPDKSSLKKASVNEYNYKTWLVGYMEDDLSVAEKAAVEDFLSTHPGYNSEFEIFLRTKSFPDPVIRFKNKNSLRKGGVVVPMWIRIAAAACILLGIGFFMLNDEPAKQIVVIPQKKTEVTVTENQSPLTVESDHEKNKEQSVSPGSKPA